MLARKLGQRNKNGRSACTAAINKTAQTSEPREMTRHVHSSHWL